MARHHLLPGFFERSATRPLFALFALAATTGLLMTMGFAGGGLLLAKGFTVRPTLQPAKMKKGAKP